MSLMDFTLPGSDPNAPNSFIRTPEQVAQQLALAQALSKGGSDYSPVQSPWQGAARMAQALAGAIGTYKANQGQRLGMANSAADFSNAFGGDPGEANIPATPGQTTPALETNDQRNDAMSDAPNAGLVAALGGAPAPSGNSVLATALRAPQGTGGGTNPMALAAGLGAGTPYGTGNVGGGTMAPYQAAISKIESGGNYGALGPVTGSGDRAYGKYQVMGANIPQWTQAALGRPMTPQQFLADPQAQDAVFNHQFGGYVQKYGPQDAASMWLTGRTLANGGAQAADQNGTTGQAYADQMTRSLGNAPAAAAITQATGGAHVPTWAEVQADNAHGMDSINAASAQPSPAGAAGASPMPGGPQGAGAGVSTPAPSQALAFAPPAGLPAPAAPPSPAAAPQPAPMQPQPGMTAGFHPNVQSLLNVLSDPWASPAQQQIAQTMLQSQMPTPPTFGVIGKDAAGNEQYGWISPKTMTVTPANPSAGVGGAGGALPPLAPTPVPPDAPQPGAPSPSSAATTPQTVAGAVNMAEANGITPQGAAYLKGMEAQGGASAVVARQARAIIDGQAPLPEGNSATKPIDVAVRDAVFRAAPGFNSTVAASRVETTKSFADKTSPTSAGGMILAANTGLHHLSALADSAEKINNSGHLPNWSPALNWLSNETKAVTVGNPALKEYEINKQALVGELAKIYKGGTPAEAEVRAMAESLSPNMTPAEQKAVFSKLSTLLQGKTDELQRQWQTAFGSKSTYPVIGEEGQRIIQRFSGGSAQASAPVTLSTTSPDADYAKLPSGAQFVGPDGHVRVKP